MKNGLLITLLMLTLVGCSTVPSSRIYFMGARADLPKDFTADHIKTTVQLGTNTFTFEATKMSTKNNPEVISASGAVTVDQIKAIGEVATDAFSKAASKTLIP